MGRRRGTLRTVHRRTVLLLKSTPVSSSSSREGRPHCCMGLVACHALHRLEGLEDTNACRSQQHICPWLGQCTFKPSSNLPPCLVPAFSGRSRQHSQLCCRRALWSRSTPKRPVGSFSSSSRGRQRQCLHGNGNCAACRHLLLQLVPSPSFSSRRVQQLSTLHLMLLRRLRACSSSRRKCLELRAMSQPPLPTRCLSWAG